MNRIGTAQGWSSALLNLLSAQDRLSTAQNQVSTQKRAVDLRGFGRGSEALAAYRSTQNRLKAYVDVTDTVGARLTSQDMFVNRVADAAKSARDAIADALASGRADSLMQAMQEHFQTAVDGLNGQHQGRYLFGGGQADTAPVSINTLSDLAAAPSVAGLFANDQHIASSRVDDTTTVQTGQLASDLGTALFTVFQSVAQYDASASGPLTGKLTTAQTTFLQARLSEFDAAHDKLIDAAARNGATQKRVEGQRDQLKAQASTLEGLISDKTDVNLAEALTRLQQAQQSVQASAQVVASIRNLSLLDYLR